MVPCGTPDKTLTSLDSAPLTMTLWVLLVVSQVVSHVWSFEFCNVLVWLRVYCEKQYQKPSKSLKV